MPQNSRPRIVRGSSATKASAVAASLCMLWGAAEAAAQSVSNKSAPTKTATAAPTASASAPAEDKRIPAPGPGAYEVEKAHIARYDAAIAAVRDQAVSSADAERLKRALTRVAAMDRPARKPQRDEIEEPIARKLVDWYRLRGGFGEPREYREFLAGIRHGPIASRWSSATRRHCFTAGGRPRDQGRCSRPSRLAPVPDLQPLPPPHLADGDEAGATPQRPHRVARAFARRDARAWFSRAVRQAADSRRSPVAVRSHADGRSALDGRTATSAPPWRAGCCRCFPSRAQESRGADCRIHAGRNGPALLTALPAEDKPDWGLASNASRTCAGQDKIEEAAKRLLAVPLDCRSAVVAGRLVARAPRARLCAAADRQAETRLSTSPRPPVH